MSPVFCVMQISPQQNAVSLQPGLGCCLHLSLQPPGTGICMYQQSELVAHNSTTQQTSWARDDGVATGARSVHGASYSPTAACKIELNPVAQHGGVVR